MWIINVKTQSIIIITLFFYFDPFLKELYTSLSNNFLDLPAWYSTAYICCILPDSVLALLYRILYLIIIWSNDLLISQPCLPQSWSATSKMYSVFLPFGAVVIDLLLVFVYFFHDQWLEGGTTAVFALFPLLVTAFLLYSKWTELKLVSTKSYLTSTYFLISQITSTSYIWLLYLHLAIMTFI